MAVWQPSIDRAVLLVSSVAAVGRAIAVTATALCGVSLG